MIPGGLLLGVRALVVVSWGGELGVEGKRENLVAGARALSAPSVEAQGGGSSWLQEMGVDHGERRLT